MYRKLTLISVVLLFGSESHSQIGFAVVAASASGIAYTLARPIKGKFEDGLQTFVLWIIFFNVCLGALYSQPTMRESQGGNNSIFVNVAFVILNSAVLFTALVKGIVHLMSAWRNISLCPVRCLCMVCDRFLGCQRSRRNNVILTQPLTEERF
ncbi:uncharacterized protein LOC111319164 [Stylophora pistillata]|uniref:uncharacterized protein LOC111319164 n=1 Tax=Stylophora pistillata TaxID=50429 RepID=UPI000C0577AC|nr:uncharacterized protein LOC111319164 [Stylophora pistillata]